MINTISLIVINTYACVFRKISIVYVLSTECTKNNVTIYHIMILLNLNFLWWYIAFICLFVLEFNINKVLEFEHILKHVMP